MFRVTIDYIEQDLTMREVSELVHKKYGDTASVSFSPISTDNDSLIEFALQSLTTEQQLNALFGTKELYPNFKRVIREKALEKVSALLDKVLEENERKF